ncbi:MAG: amidase [Myxococcota bacterium]
MNPPDYSIDDLQRLFESGEGNAESVCEAYLSRIESLDRNGPKLRALVELNPDALDAARALDVERAQRGPRGPLHGVPLVVKDSIDTGDQMMTTGGSLALVGNRAPTDAFAVAELRKAGAVILGKSNMSEWGYFRSSRPCSGWSSRGGQTRNPYVLDRTPGGSSSGSAAAVAANLCVGALGAEVDGSVVHPSSMCGLVGLKPTVGLVSRSGVMGICEPQDTLGPMARTVTDLAILLGVIAGPDPEDPRSAEGAHHARTEYRQALDPSGLEGARIGVVTDYLGFHEGADAVVEHALETMAGLGAVIVREVSLGTHQLLSNEELVMCLHTFKVQTNRYLAEHPSSPARTLDDVIAFNRAHADRVMPFFGQEILEQANATTGLDAKAYLDARETCRRQSRDEGIDAAMKAHQLDALVAPTTGTPAFAIDVMVGDKILGGCFPMPAMAGYPHLTMPGGYVNHLPVGVSLFSGPYREPDLLRYAFALEQALPKRRPPEFLPSIPLGRSSRR